MPPMKAMGINTEDKTSAMPMTGVVTSSIALMVASLGVNPCSMLCSTASTTTIASSTTSPMARMSPKRDRVLIEKPSKGKMANVPISDTGTATRGMRVARQPCFQILHLLFDLFRHSQCVGTGGLVNGNDDCGLPVVPSDLLINK